MYRKAIAILMALALLAGTTIPASAANRARVNGENRYDTAVNICKSQFDKCERAIIANGVNYVDALPASTLANLQKAPILLTEASSLSQDTKSELERLGVTKVTVLGGTATISEDVVSQLNSMGIEVLRIGGADRYKTSELIYEEIVKHTEVLQVFFAATTADAVSSSAYRGDKIPLILVNGNEPPSIPQTDMVKKVILGGEASVTKEAFEVIGATERIGGSNRYETAILLADKNKMENGVVNAIVVNGVEFVDAFTATTYVFTNKLNILLSPGKYMESFVHGWIDANKPDITIIGGENSISEDALSKTEPDPEPEPEPVPEPKPEPGIDPSKPMIAITYDDGPRSGSTETILDVLKANKAKATFFVLGQNVYRYPDIIKRQVAEGHEIGNHSYDHPSLTSLSYNGIVDQISRTTAAIQEIGGVTPVLCRPTYGNMNQTVRDAVPMPLIMWSVDTRDWESRNANAVTSIILNQVKDGDIILMHDIHSPTATATGMVIPQLVQRGFQLVTVSELFHYKGITPSNGLAYYNSR